eukprot:GDKJ01017384.1.p1 GENE.GDKJ01017384.1~~GDKJ01017384.1.p1  ORF type:complete len:403 (-),score=62.15 GDKJ01017384.1:81-1289(-)
MNYQFNQFPGASTGFAPPPNNFGSFPPASNWGQPFPGVQSQPPNRQPSASPFAPPINTAATPAPFTAQPTSFKPVPTGTSAPLPTSFGSTSQLNSSQSAPAFAPPPVPDMWGQPMSAGVTATTPTPHFAPPAPFGNTPFGNTWSQMSSNPLFGASTTIASSIINDASETTKSFVHDYLGSLRPYFAVSNRSVINSLFRTIFPFMSLKNSGSNDPASPTSTFSIGPGMSSNSSTSSFKTPPIDLYVPLMALITFTLLSSIAKGQKGEFSPEMMGTILTMCCFCALVDVCVGKLGLYLFSIHGVHSLSLLAAASGKFTHLSFITFLAIVGAPWMYWPTFIYFLAASAFHTFTQFNEACKRSRSRNSDADWGAAAFNASGSVGNQMIVGIVLTVLQVLYLWCLSP